MSVRVFPSSSTNFCLVSSSLSTLKLILYSGLCLTLLFLHIFCFRVIMTGWWSVSRLMFGIARASFVFRLSFALVKMKSIWDDTPRSFHLYRVCLWLSSNCRMSLWSKDHAQDKTRAAVLHCSCILYWRHCVGQSKFPMVFFLGLPFHWSLSWRWDHHCLVLSQLCQIISRKILLSPLPSTCHCMVHRSVWSSHSCACTWSHYSFWDKICFQHLFCSVWLHDKSYPMDGSCPRVHSTPC